MEIQKCRLKESHDCVYLDKDTDITEFVNTVWPGLPMHLSGISIFDITDRSTGEIEGFRVQSSFGSNTFYRFNRWYIRNPMTFNREWKEVKPQDFEAMYEIVS